jgi:ubiquinone/menaquinone biosynthesis C-methylase UbiE
MYLTRSGKPKAPAWNQWIYHELVGRLANGKRWLELGCGRGPFDPVISLARRRYKESQYVGVDLSLQSLMANPFEGLVCSDIGQLPFADGYFEVVSSNMVFEHLKEPRAAMHEIRRVLSRDGIAVIHAASSRHFSLIAGRLIARCVGGPYYRSLVSRYSGRQEGDVFPTFYRANSAARAQKLAEESGMWASFVTYLETPPVFAARFGAVERVLRHFLPAACKGSLLLICMKDKPSDASCYETVECDASSASLQSASTRSGRA